MRATSREAHDAVERFRVLTASAVDACARGSTMDLVDALQAREEVARWMRGVTAPPVQSGASAASPELRALRRAAEEALHLNAELEAGVARARDEARARLQQLDHDQAAVGGYSRAMPRVRQLDLRR
jgi:hypothetical protein